MLRNLVSPFCTRMLGFGAQDLTAQDQFGQSSPLLLLFSHWRGCKLLNSSPSPLDAGLIWSISQPYCSIVTYLLLCIEAPQLSFRNDESPGSGVPFCQTASIVFSLNGLPTVPVLCTLAIVILLFILWKL